jgi:hypothetical protein
MMMKDDWDRQQGYDKDSAGWVIRPPKMLIDNRCNPKDGLMMYWEGFWKPTRSGEMEDDREMEWRLGFPCASPEPTET